MSGAQACAHPIPERVAVAIALDPNSAASLRLVCDPPMGAQACSLGEGTAIYKRRLPRLAKGCETAHATPAGGGSRPSAATPPAAPLQRLAAGADPGLDLHEPPHQRTPCRRSAVRGGLGDPPGTAGDASHLLSLSRRSFPRASATLAVGLAATPPCIRSSTRTGEGPPSARARCRL
jgi:hypothetical protein